MKVQHVVLDARDHVGTDGAIRDAVLLAVGQLRRSLTTAVIPTMIDCRVPGGVARIERLHVVENRATCERTVTAFWHLDQPGAPWMSTCFRVGPELLAS